MEHFGEGTEKIKKSVKWMNKIYRRTITKNDQEYEIEEISGDDNKSISSDILPSLGAHPHKISLRHFIVSPFDRRYRAWEGLLVLLVFYSAWFCPFEFGLIKKSHGTLSITDNVVNGFFAIDIVLRFFVAYLDKATYVLVDDRNKIARRYVKSWFVLDVLSIIPTEVTRSVLPESAASFGYFALLRLWRLRRACKMFASLEKDRNYSNFWIICSKLICVTLFAVHSAACFMMEAAKLAASHSNYLVEECKKRVEELEIQTSEAKQLEISAPEFTESIIKQLEKSNGLLHDAESEISSLKEKVSLLEFSNKRQKEDFEEAGFHLGVAREEASKLQEEVKSLKSELEDVKEEKNQALNNEKSDIMAELEKSGDEEKEDKEAMESLASALHKASSEAREAKEQLLSFHAERERFETEISSLKEKVSLLEISSKRQTEDFEEAGFLLGVAKEEAPKLQEEVTSLESKLADVEEKNQALNNEKNYIMAELEKSRDEEKEGKKAMESLKAANEKYELMLDETKKDIDNLVNSLKQSKQENQKLKDEWEQKAVQLMHSVKVYEEKNISMEKEFSRLVILLHEAEEKVSTSLEENTYPEKSINETESEVICLNYDLGGAKAESMQLKESLIDEENEELTKSLEEASSRKKDEENDELSESEKDYEVPKVVDFSEQNGSGVEMPNFEVVPQQHDVSFVPHLEEVDNVLQKEAVLAKCEEKAEETEKKNTDPDNTDVVESKTGESSPEREQEAEALDDNSVSNAESESSDETNGLTTAVSIIKAETSLAKGQSPRKKKPSIFKFGSFLKKKGSSTEK